MQSIASLPWDFQIFCIHPHLTFQMGGLSGGWVMIFVTFVQVLALWA